METGFIWPRRWTSGILMLVFLFLLPAGWTEESSLGPPGKPRLLGCRSPEKETFTCRWERGSSGGLPTSYALYYHMENSEKIFECPDYHTAGENSCFFNKTYTSIWVSYNITVVARNALGIASSDSMDVDVMYIVQPHHPNNVTVTLEDRENPYLQVKWEKPHMVDTRSGWVTLNYELSVRLEKDNKTEFHFAGQQKHFQIFRPIPGEVYTVRVRCKPDHGYWSEWSAPAYVKVPDYLPREKSMWIVLAIFSAFALLILSWVVILKKSSVKLFFLPPVPGPKIKGFDNSLLKKGKSEEIFHVLVSQGFPPTSDSEDLLVDCLEVSESLQRDPDPTPTPSLDGEEQEKDQRAALIDKSQWCPSIDHTLQVENYDGESSAPSTGQMGTVFCPREMSGWSGNSSQVRKLDQCVDDKANMSSSTRHCCVQEPVYHAPEVLIEGVPPAPLLEHQIIRADFPLCDIPTDSDDTQSKSGPNGNCGAAPRPHDIPMVLNPTEYVEVHNVNQENRLILKPKAKEDTEALLQRGLRGQDYSKVSELVNDHLFLLERGLASAGPEYSVTEGPLDDCAQQWQLAKPAPNMGPNGYVDVGTMLPPY